jgi:DNA-binding transcriptional LysR family regulator
VVIGPTDYGALRAFAAVAEAASFTQAAAQLGVSASALSQTIRGLEDRLGVLLFNRTTRSVALTPGGTELLRSVRPAMAELDRGFRAARSGAGEIVGSVRIHVARLAAWALLAPRLAAFTASHPRITLDLTLDDRTVDFVTAGFDAAIRVGEVIGQDMETVRLGPDLRQVAVASPAYLAEHGAPAVPEDLHRHRCIQWRWPGQEQPHPWEFVRDDRWFKVAVDGPLIVSDRTFGVEAAAAGVGIAFAAEQTAASHVANGTLVPLLTEWCGTFPGFFLCHPRHHHAMPALQAFIAAVLMP